MRFIQYEFLFPIVFAFALILAYVLRKSRFRRVRSRYRRMGQVLDFIRSFILPGKETRLYKKYCHILRYTKWGVGDIYKVKALLFMLVFVLLVLIKLTNISLYSKEILNSFDYHQDLIYQNQANINEARAMKQEMKYFSQALELIDSKTIKNTPKDQIENIINTIIAEGEGELLQSKEAMANKLYYRIHDYYECRQWNLLLYFVLALFASYVLELFLLGYNFFADTEAKKELRFLKKLIIMNGSIKPVDFMKLLKILSEKAKYHKRMLVEIEEMNRKNSVDNRDIYQMLGQDTKNIEMKLFYEKLDQANNYEFDQAITNIENEFQMDRRAQARKIKKQTELIHAVGITGFMALVFILILYMIIPWLEMYNMHQIY